MKYEYLIFNFIVILGPIVFSFDQKVRYVKKWGYSLRAVFMALIPFILWDMAVAGRHWWFNENLTLNKTLLGLPPGEWLFFITVPFASLFVWEIIAVFKENHKINFIIYLNIFVTFLLPLSIYLFYIGKEYTGLVLFSLFIIFILDVLLKTRLFYQKRVYLYLAIYLGLVFIFNSYLTARPLVLYNEDTMLNIRLFTIPIEDFGFGLSHIMLSTIFYEKIKRVLIE